MNVKGPGAPCTECGAPLPLDSHYNRRAHAGCYSARSSRFNKETRNKMRGTQEKRDQDYRHHIRKKFKLSKEEANAVMARTTCEGCGKDPEPGARRFGLDHCHRTGKVRGILCRACNTALGCVEDDPERLLALIAYLEKHRDD